MQPDNATTPPDLKFICGHICMAARVLRFKLKWARERFMWLDATNGRVITCPPANDKEIALYLACQTLVNQIQWTKNQ